MPGTLSETLPTKPAQPERREPPEDDTPFICFCGQDWWYHNRAHSDFQLMTRIAKTRKVLLINSIGMRMPTPGKSAAFFTRVFRKLGSMLKFVRRPLPELPNYRVMTPIMLPFYGSKWARDLSAWLVRKQVELVAKWSGIDNPNIFVTVPTALPIATRMKRKSLIYNRSDKHSEFGEADQGFIRGLEDGLLEQSDLVLYVSRELQSEEASKTGNRSYFLDHGVDLEHFTRTEREPIDLESIDRPRIGFFGGLDDYTVDFDLIEKVAREIPEAQVILVGRAMCSMDRFQNLSNVHVLGFKAYDQVPAYGSAFDVAIMPWLDNSWIQHCNPIKLKEYLALELPIVSTYFPEIRHYTDLVRVAKDHTEFVSLIRTTLEDRGPATRAERRDSVAGATWDARTDELLRTCSTLATAPCNEASAQV